MGLLKEKSFKLAVRVVNLYKIVANERKEFVMSKQLLRSGTSIGANIREANYGESKKDFIHKLAIAQKEADETIYWMELLKATDYLSIDEFESISQDAIEIIKMITASIKTAKNSLKENV